jgi:hypothetical protein
MPRNWSEQNRTENKQGYYAHGLIAVRNDYAAGWLEDNTLHPASYANHGVPELLVFRYTAKVQGSFGSRVRASPQDDSRNFISLAYKSRRPTSQTPDFAAA